MAPKWRTNAPNNNCTNTGAARDRDPFTRGTELVAKLLVPRQLHRRRRGPRAEHRVNERGEVAHAEEQVPGRHEPHELEVDRGRAEQALRDHHAEQRPAELAQLRPPKLDQQRQKDLEATDRHRCEPVAVLVQDAARHVREDRLVANDERFGTCEGATRRIDHAADDQQQKGRAGGELGYAMFEHGERLKPGVGYHI
ncbi:MAG: hypothetical protein QM831_14040 [Kofleriaceae bacterium]